MPTTRYTVILAGVTLPASSVLEISGQFDLTTSSGNPLAVGGTDTMTCRISILRSALPINWRFATVQIVLQVDASSITAFKGVIVQQTGDPEVAELSCEGYVALIRKTRSYSPLFLARPAATATTASSIEDPSNPAYGAGLINYALWQAAGRPLLQAATYPGATFYYHLDQSILTIPVAWLAGNSAWEECSKLAQASAGMLYQDRDGTVRFRQILSLAEPSAAAVIDEAVYSDLPIDGNTNQTFTRVVVPYIPRRIPVAQECVRDDTPVLIGAGEVKELPPIEPQWPLYNRPDLPAVSLKAFDYRYNPITPTATISQSAQRIDITLDNSAGTQPYVLQRVVVTGRPVQPGERKVASAGTGSDQDTFTLSDNEYIQTESHASRLARLLLAFYSSRLTYKATGCPYNPARTVGDVVSLSNRKLGLVNLPCLVIGIEHADTGTEMTLTLAPVADLPRRSDMFVLGQTYASGDVRKLSY